MDDWEELEEGQEDAAQVHDAQEANFSFAQVPDPGNQHSGAERRHNASRPDSRLVSHQQATPSGRALTQDLVLRALKATRHTDAASLEKQLAKATHLHLNNLHLSHLEGKGLQGLPNLETLYLFDNLLVEPVGLTGLSGLTSLYLQNNNITSLTALNSLTRLQKLYLEGNALSEVSGLSGLHELEELHVSSQRPTEGGLRFNPDCMAALAPSLRVLCAINCQLQDESLASLTCLPELRKLDLGQNHLTSLDALEEVVRGAPHLLNMDVSGNPMSRQPKYHENVIVMSDRLMVLDGQPVSAKQREVLMRLQIKRMKAQLAAESPAPASRRSASAPSAPLQDGSAPTRPHHLHQQPVAARAAGSVTPQAVLQPGAGRAAGALTPQAMHRPTGAAPPMAAGFGQPRHLAQQVSGSGRRKGAGVPSIPTQGGVQGLELGMQGVQLVQPRAQP